MVKADVSVQWDTRDLAHPVYLDVPMLVSFLAVLDDGVSFRSEVAERVGEAKKSTAEGGGKFGLPSLASLLGLTLSVSGQYTRDRATDESAESKFVREHTSASLFNRFRSRLDAGALTLLSSAGQLEDLGSSTLVEVNGYIEGNPLRQTLDLFVAFAPFFGLSVEEDAEVGTLIKAKQPRSRGRGGQANDSSAGGFNPETAKILELILHDAKRSPVIDLLMKSETDLRAVLTVSREFLTAASEAYLLGGRFTVIGKTTNVLADGDELNLLRRTALGYGGPKLADTVFESLISDDNELDIRLASPLVKGPAVQILPLAIYA